MIFPRPYKERNLLDPLLGIKSSLSKLRSVVAMTYVLYIANGKRDSIEYCDEYTENGNTKIKLKKTIEDQIAQLGFSVANTDNQLLDIQFEPLYVGLSMMFSLAKLSFCDNFRSNTCERTGGNRYSKRLDFASNIILLDLLLDGFNEVERNNGIQNWLENKKANSPFEERVCRFLTIQVHKVLCKLKTDNGDLIYRLEGIYDTVLNGNVVSFGNGEIVGPTRILNNVISENIDVHLKKSKNGIEIIEELKEETQSWFRIINTSFDITSIKIPSYESESANDNNTTDDSHNILETPIANYITQHDDEEWSLEQLQEECQRMYDNGENKPLAMHIFGILFAPHIDTATAITSKLKTIGKEEGENNYHAEVNKGKNIGLFLRKFIQKGACPTLSPEDLEVMKQYIDIFTNALKTKPFLLLAGISGTGKSQKVKELAYASCPNDKELRSDETKPGNYCLIEVKPNWHDSTELLGYWSNLSQKYMLTDFIRFAYKASKHPNVPFFLCLDEMNLAPVEQYFAEYLSVLESRKVYAGEIVSEPLLTKDKFSDCKLIDKEGNNLYENPTDRLIIEYLKVNGLRLPDNLFVIGTVNMDDTTHQFSRKVIDRAFTIEMNGGKLEDMFSDENTKKLEYRPDGQEAKLELFKSNYTKATEAIDSEKVKPFAEVIKTEVPKLLNVVNNILAKTPFRVSYRVQNEMVLYICNAIENATEDIDINAVIGTAFLATLLEKILPRVQGDERLLKTAEGNVFTDLKKYVEQMQNAENTAEGETNFKALVVSKLDEMNDRLTKSYFASFFG